MDAICISDLHLGSHICQAKLLEDFLKKIRHEVSFDELILNGDVFDSWDFRRLKKHHWNILSQLRKLSDNVKVVYIAGNHDGPAELISHLIGTTVVDEYVLDSGNKTIWFHHGHCFDKFIVEHPFIVWIADYGYSLLQKIDSSFILAQRAKQSSKTFLRISELVERKSMEFAIKHGYDIVCTGHTHYAIAKSNYFNSGSWTELPCHYLEINDGQVKLCEYKAGEEHY